MSFIKFKNELSILKIVNGNCLNYLVLIIVFFAFRISFSQSYFVISNSNSYPIFIPICQNCFATSIRFVIRSLYSSFPLQMDSPNRRKPRGQQTPGKSLQIGATNRLHQLLLVGSNYCLVCDLRFESFLIRNEFQFE